MKFCFITPIPDLERFAISSNFHLVLVHIAKVSPKYHRFYRNRSKAGDYVILDNGAWERDISVSSDELLDMAKEMKAKEVVAPDKLYDKNETIKMTRDFLSIVPPKLKVQAVPQGQTVQEWKECFNELTKLQVDVIGLSKAPKYKSSRTERALYCLKEKPNITYHLLGLDNPLELTNPIYKNPQFRSIDSKIAFKYGAQGLCLRDIREPLNVPHLDLFKPLPPLYYPIIEDNIKYIEELL